MGKFLAATVAAATSSHLATFANAERHGADPRDSFEQMTVMHRWIGQDKCVEPMWVDLWHFLNEKIQAGNPQELVVAVSRKLVNVLQSPFTAFNCGIGVAAAYHYMAIALETMNMPYRAQRARQAVAIFIGFDLQFKGEEHIDSQPWGFKYQQTIEAMLTIKQRTLDYEKRAAPAMFMPLSQIVPAPKEDISLGIITVCEYNEQKTPLGILSKLNKERYVDKHNFKLHFYNAASVLDDVWSRASLREDPEAHSQRPAAWSKIDAMISVLGEAEHDWVLWMDCDSFFMDFDMKITRALEYVAQEHSATQGLTPEQSSLLATDADRAMVRQMHGWTPASGEGAPLSDLQREFDGFLDSILGPAPEPPAGFAVPEFGWAPRLFSEKRLNIVMSEDGLMVNTGMIFARTSGFSYWFLQKVRQLSFVGNPVTVHPWWDQTGVFWLGLLPFTVLDFAAGDANSIRDLPVNGGFAPSIGLLSQRHINAYPPLVASALLTHYHYQQGDFIVAFSGCKIFTSQEVCNALFMSYAHDSSQQFMDDPKLENWVNSPYVGKIRTEL